MCGDGYLIAGDSGMLFNALHREGLEHGHDVGPLAAEAIVEALERGDFTRKRPCRLYFEAARDRT